MALPPETTAYDEYYKQKNQREIDEVAAKAAEAVEAKKVADVKAGGQAKAAKIKTGTNLALAGIKAWMRQREIARLRAAQAADRAAMKAPILTDKALAMLSSTVDASEREEKANLSRGLGGVDEARMRAAHKEGLLKGAGKLSAYQEGELGRRALVAKVAKERGEEFGERVAEQRKETFKDIGEVLSDKAVVSMLGKAGKRKREKLGLGIGEATETLKSEVETA